MSLKNLVKVLVSRIPILNSYKMASAEAIQKLESRAIEAENIISVLKAEVAELHKIATVVQQNETARKAKFELVKQENEKLKNEVEEWKKRLLEAQQGIAVPPQKAKSPSPVKAEVKARKSKSPERVVVKTEAEIKPEPVTPVQEKKEKVKAEKKPKAAAPAAAASDEIVDVRRLDMRVGKIVNVKKHPDADSLYVEEVDIGEAKPRTVVSGLVKHVPIEEMENRMVVLLCNMKPAKMRGVTSEAMVLCASTPEKVEILSPPEGSVPGDRITVEGYEGTPDPVLNPKKKIFETVAPDLKTNDGKVATYKGAVFTVPGKGVVTAPSLVGVNIK